MRSVHLIVALGRVRSLKVKREHHSGYLEPSELVVAVQK